MTDSDRWGSGLCILSRPSDHYHVKGFIIHSGDLARKNCVLGREEQDFFFFFLWFGRYILSKNVASKSIITVQMIMHSTVTNMIFGE